ncbi:MAG: hypothetical protein CME62_05860 [Halobacteriovoraceae bacterium]|nr:hypothetical protein [Halobacteriovoraceae bacterium]
MKLKTAALVSLVSLSSFATGLMPEAICTGADMPYNGVEPGKFELIVHVNGEVNYCKNKIDSNVAISIIAEGPEGNDVSVMLGKMKVKQTPSGNMVTITPKTSPKGMSFKYTIAGVPGRGEGVLTTPAEPEYGIQAETIKMDCEFPHYIMDCDNGM